MNENELEKKLKYLAEKYDVIEWTRFELIVFEKKQRKTIRNLCEYQKILCNSQSKIVMFSSWEECYDKLENCNPPSVYNPPICIYQHLFDIILPTLQKKCLNEKKIIDKVYQLQFM